MNNRNLFSRSVLSLFATHVVIEEDAAFKNKTVSLKGKLNAIIKKHTKKKSNRA